ncbi:MAG: glycosyltransferase [Alphaproteobacteria bacterium]|nr:glycosyltransferase [Alphaproteobacteria bacterium]
MMRVLQAMAGAEHGGAEAFFERLAPALGRAGLEQRVLMRENDERAGVLRAGGIEPVQLAFGGLLDLSTKPAFKREIASFKPDIVMTWMSRATRFCPRGDFVHVARLGGYYDLKYYDNCNHLVGNTPDIVAYAVRGGWPQERAHYLPNFVDCEPMPAIPRATLGVPETAKLLLALGRLHTNKAFDVLIDALPSLPDAWLLLAGEGPEEAALKERAAKLGVDKRVKFLGWRRDVSALYSTADMLVCSSRYEPLGNIVIEAWAHQRPVVAARSMGPSHLIHHDDLGVLVPVDDAASLADGIRRVFDDGALRARIVEAGRKHYEAEFTEQAIVARYLAFFKAITA